MKQEMELKIQAWLDGETSNRDAARIAEWVLRDAEAGALAAELGAVKQKMLDGEANLRLPETREFFWSKIERQIQREALPPRNASVSWVARWRRMLVPLTAALIFVLTVAVNQIRQPAFDEVSDTNEGMEPVTFHDQSANMTVVWLQDNSQATGAAEPTAEKSTMADDANSDTETE